MGGREGAEGSRIEGFSIMFLRERCRPHGNGLSDTRGGEEYLSYTSKERMVLSVHPPGKEKTAKLGESHSSKLWCGGRIVKGLTGNVTGDSTRRERALVCRRLGASMKGSVKGGSTIGEWESAGRSIPGNRKFMLGAVHHWGSRELGRI